MGLTEPGASVLIRAAYKLLKQQTFYRSKRGSCLDNRCWVNCPTSGRSDSYRLRKGFIRAEVIAYEDFVQYGSEAKCKEAGKFKVEGKSMSLKMVM
jgi:hypothetical protein